MVYVVYQVNIIFHLYAMLVVLQIICVLYKKVEKEYTRRVKKLIYKYVRLIIVEIFDGRDQKTI